MARISVLSPVLDFAARFDHVIVEASRRAWRVRRVCMIGAVLVRVSRIVREFVRIR